MCRGSATPINCPRTRKDVARFAYRSIPYVWATTLFCTDPSVARLQGWKEERLLTHFARYLRDEFSPSTWRFLGEVNATGIMRRFLPGGWRLFADPGPQGAGESTDQPVSQDLLADAEHPHRDPRGRQGSTRGHRAL